ncbi:MAG: hypothetical protein C6Y22_01065 [Hapalosiphonaceae cyanobacterium JJU2]|nr:MAG: hypothetical protein C6Y22_01065 [Hapalosiphonaceae cyanobacterium JJU2]
MYRFLSINETGNIPATGYAKHANEKVEAATGYAKHANEKVEAATGYAKHANEKAPVITEAHTVPSGQCG